MSRLSIEIPEAVHRQIKAQASLEGISIREYVLQRLRARPGSEPGAVRDEPSQDNYPTSVWGWLDRPSLQTRTKAEIDAYLDTERAGWNDDD